ncbi:hypothetical protein GYMLUDRAFT_552737 [Collybiopsis luxurians FD-317 M1]|uniref:Uncharacterized protein n=1 Tax=Collybiopsis luxurians FD-317 M1 TaxID=944289 RepID=A0A0D0CSB4_9AGAR|nr:hypothetical protein GYMLUDRAFT_552737 [Collybiopsis luxurians FD-317 M1]
MFAQALTPLKRQRTPGLVSSATLAWGLKTRLEGILDTLRSHIAHRSPQHSMVPSNFLIDDQLTRFNMLNRHFWLHCAAYCVYTVTLIWALEAAMTGRSNGVF